MDAVTASSALMSLIFGWIHAPPALGFSQMNQKQANICLFSCSRVNKLWHNESCRILWKRQRNLSNAVALLRPDNLNAFLTPLEAKCIASGSISLFRFSHYARWISHLTCSITSDCSDLKDAYLLSKGPLFPCLQNLTFLGIDRSYHMTALALLGPRIKMIHLGLKTSPETAVLLMSRLGEIQLHELYIPLIKPSTDERIHLLHVLNGQQLLTQLDLDADWVDVEVFYAIGCLPRLFTLKIADHWQKRPPAVGAICDATFLERFEARGSMFPSLKKLTLTSAYVVWMKLSDTVFADTKLSSVALTLIFIEQEAIQADLDIILPSGNRLTSLEEIDVTLDSEWDSDDPPVRATAGTLQPLSKCYLLRQLYVRVSRALNINDKELLSLAKNWPNLTDLHFTGTMWVRQEDIHGLSINIIGEIPAICPKISDLTLTSSSSVEFESARKMPPSSTLKFLDLGPSFLFDSELPDWSTRLLRIAAYLALIIPATCSLCFDVVYDDLDHDFSNEEWSELVTAHEESTAAISNHRAAILLAQNLQIHLDNPRLSACNCPHDSCCTNALDRAAP